MCCVIKSLYTFSCRHNCKRFFNSHHYHNMVAPEFSVANPSFENTPTNPYMNIPNLERPPDTAVNIQRGRPPIQSNTINPQSPSFSSMDSLPPSEMDYAERINIENNRMDIKTTNQEMKGLYSSAPSLNTLQTPPQNEEASNSITAPVTPTAIPYEANSPADPNLWDGHFGPVSLFGTNEVLQNDMHNISCSLIRIAQFIRQRNISNWDGNMIPQLNSFGDAAFDFILAIHETGWNKLNTLDNRHIENKIKEQFRHQPSANREKINNLMKRTPPQIPQCHMPKRRHKQLTYLNSKMPSRLYQTRK